MTVAARRLDDATLASGALAATFDRPRPLADRGVMQRATGIAGDVLAAVTVVLFIPFVILAIGIPFALFVRLLLWAVGM